MFKIGDQVLIKKDVLEEKSAKGGYWSYLNRLTLLKEHWDRIFTIIDIDGLGLLHKLDVKVNLPPDTGPELIFFRDELNNKSCDCPINLILIRGCQNKDHI